MHGAFDDVMRSNASAHALYLRMGFRDHAEPVVRVVSAPATQVLSTASARGDMVGR